MFKGKYRWFIMLLITILMFVNFMDRIVISLATGPIMEEFGFSGTQWGIILSSFFWGLVPFTFLMGIWTDKFGPKKIWTWTVLWWSLFTAATAFSFNFISMVIARIGFGIGESSSMATGLRVISNWMSPKENGRAFGVANCGVFIAPALGSPIFVWMIATYGWRAPFYLLGGLGIIWVLIWLKFFTDRPHQNKYVSKEEKQWLTAEQKQLFVKESERKKVGKRVTSHT